MATLLAAHFANVIQMAFRIMYLPAIAIKSATVWRWWARLSNVGQGRCRWSDPEGEFGNSARVDNDTLDGCRGLQRCDRLGV